MKPVCFFWERTSRQYYINIEMSVQWFSILDIRAVFKGGGVYGFKPLPEMSGKIFFCTKFATS